MSGPDDTADPPGDDPFGPQETSPFDPSTLDDDDDKTVMAPLPIWDDALPDPDTSAPDLTPPRGVDAPLPAVDTSEAGPCDPLFGHGLAAALRSAARRSKGAVHPETIKQMARAGKTAHEYPDLNFPNAEIEDTFATLVEAARQDQDREISEPDPAPTWEGEPSERELQDWNAVGLGLFSVLRDLERRAGLAPRIGRNERLGQALVSLGQDPLLGFQGKDIARYDPAQQPPMVRAQFMGFFGPFGAFPLNWSEEVNRWFQAGDESFAAFTDIFTTRFQELFFRAWSDARAITQFDHPSDDRFQTYLLSLLGNGTAAMRDRDSVADTVKLRFAGLASGRVKSPVRLEQILRLHFDGLAQVDIDELVPTWLEFEPETLSALGQQGATLGRDMHLGSRVQSVSEKIRLNLRVSDIDTYFRLLPGRDLHAQMRDITFWYLGLAYEIEVALWLPQPEIRPAVLGDSAHLGWMACIAPDPGNPEHLVRTTRFTLLPPSDEEVQAGTQDMAA